MCLKTFTMEENEQKKEEKMNTEREMWEKRYLVQRRSVPHSTLWVWWGEKMSTNEIRCSRLLLSACVKTMNIGSNDNTRIERRWKGKWKEELSKSVEMKIKCKMRIPTATQILWRETKKQSENRMKWKLCSRWC